MEKKNQKDKATQNLEKEVTNLVTVYISEYARLWKEKDKNSLS